MKPVNLFVSVPLLARACLALLVFILAGCTNSLVVEGDFPQPLVEKLPLTLGVYYPEGFRKYTYEEKSNDRSRWIIESGAAQEAMFAAILPGMFERVVEVDAIPPAGDIDIDLIFSPVVEEFQYAVPRETKVNVFEVWIKFNLQVYDKNGEPVADWIMPAYGKTPTAFLKSKEEAMNETVVVALRDIGASLSLGFAHVPEIKAWLEQRQHTMLTTE